MTLYLNYWTLTSFLIGIFTAPMWPAMPDWIWLAPCFGCLVVSLKLNRLRVLIGPSIACAVILIHGNLLQHQTNELFKAEQNIIINAEVDSFFKQISHGFQGIVVVRSINGRKLNAFEQPKIWLVSPNQLEIGDKLTTQMVIKPITGLMNDVGFDAEKHALAKGVIAKGTIRHSTSFYFVRSGSLRQVIFSRASEQTSSLDNGPLIEALLFGVRHRISDEVWERFKGAGLSHLIAISGLHIGIIFGVGWWAGRILLTISPRMFFAPVLIGLSLAMLYAWLAGFSIPTRRALLMCVLFSALQFSGRYLPLLMKWLVVFAALLVMEPFSTLDMGLWMSMSAVGTIFIYLAVKNRTRRGVGLAIEIQCFIVIAMSPIVAALFQGISLSSVLYNLLFVPWFSFVVIPIAFLSLLVSLWDSSYAMTWQLVNLTLEPVVFLSSFSHFSWLSLSAFHITLLSAFAIIVCLSIWLNRQALVLGIGIAAFATYDWKPTPLWELVVLDVGHGLAVVVIQGRRALVYDTGPSWEGSGITQQVVIPYLQARGIDSLDFFIVSHFDNDHAGGWEEIEGTMNPSVFVSSQHRPGNAECVEGASWEWGDLTLEVLWPPKLVPRAYNPQSCVVKLTSRQAPFSVLLPGDIESIAEWLLLRNKTRLDSDILLVPHHGSKTSSLPQFIDAVSPDYAIASTAKVGRWALPDASVVARYEQRGVIWKETGRSGQVTVEFYPDGYQVEALRESKGRAWYRQMLRKGVE